MMMPLKGLRPKKAKRKWNKSEQCGRICIYAGHFFLCKAAGPTFAASLPPDKKMDGKYYKPDTRAGKMTVEPCQL